MSEASLTTCVRGLRLGLGDQTRRGGTVETVHGRGYRFHATVRASPDAVGKRSIRIAVAPFATEVDSDRYLAAGLAAEVAAGLDRWRASGLEAIARTSAERGLELREDPLAFAEALDLDFLATGRTVATARELRIDLELTRVEDRAVVWSKTFIEPARESGFIAAEIAEALAKRLLVSGPISSPSLVVPPLSTDARAHHALLRGYFLNQNRTESGLRRSIECFERAVARDSRCAAAYAALGEAYLMHGWRAYEEPLAIAPLARQALARALAIDPDSPQADAARAFLAAFVDRDRRTADEALAIVAGSGSAHDRSAWLSGMTRAPHRSSESRQESIAGLREAKLEPSAPEGP